MNSTLFQENPAQVYHPEIVVLYQRSLETPRAHKPLSVRWKIASGVVVLSFLLIGAKKHIKPANVITFSRFSSMPDYARYRWTGFHRTVTANKAPIYKPAPVVLPQTTARV